MNPKAGICKSSLELVLNFVTLFDLLLNLLPALTGADIDAGKTAGFVFDPLMLEDNAAFLEILVVFLGGGEDFVAALIGRGETFFDLFVALGLWILIPAMSLIVLVTFSLL